MQMPLGWPPVSAQIAELTRELGLRGAGVPRTRKGEGTSESQDIYATRCLQAALLTLVAVRDGTLPPRS